MSGPVDIADAAPVPAHGDSEPPCVEVTDSREAQVGHLRVRRALPRRTRRTVGAWCFADHMGPADVTEESGLDLGPHPHIGLQTVTWLVDGQVLHRDSLGTEQVITPGQLNLMTAGHGVSHSEEATGAYRGELEGVQLWIAQPSGTRDGEPAFEHHADLPKVQVDRAVATVLVGEFVGATSPARHDTPLVGADLQLDDGMSAIPVRPEWEYALVVLRGVVVLDGQPVTPGHLAYRGAGRDEIALEVVESSRAILLGGEPFEERIVMWWNFVGRSRDEIEAAYQSWDRPDGRFGDVRSPLRRIVTTPPIWRAAGNVAPR